jgi:enamine deaminase RidA (YjgF/YER057c/UK114 family)
MARIEARLAELGFPLPDVPKPVAAYVPAVQAGNLVFTSGQIPMRDGKLAAVGIVGDSVSLEQSQECARICAINALAAIRGIVGDLDRVVRVVKVGVFVAATPAFADHPKVANGASEFLMNVFGDAGRHARAAVGCSSLPLQAPVEVEMIVEVA